MAFSSISIITDDVSALVVAFQQHATQLSGLFATSGLFSGTLAVTGAMYVSSRLTVTSLATFSGPVSIAGSLTVTGALNAAVGSVGFATSAAGASSFAISSTLTVGSAATFSAPVTITGVSAIGLTLSTGTSYIGTMLAMHGQGISLADVSALLASFVAVSRAPLLVATSANDPQRVYIANRDTGTLARAGVTALANVVQLRLEAFGEGATGSVITLPGSNLADLVVVSAAHLLIRTTSFSAPIVLATNNVERIRANSGGVSVASNLTVGGTAYVYGSMTVVGTLSATVCGVTTSAQFAQSATSAAYAGSAGIASSTAFRGVVVVQSAGVSLVSSAQRALSWTSAVFDTTGGVAWSAGGNVSVLRIPANASVVQFHANAEFQFDAAGFRRANISSVASALVFGANTMFVTQQAVAVVGNAMNVTSPPFAVSTGDTFDFSLRPGGSTSSPSAVAGAWFAMIILA